MKAQMSSGASWTLSKSIVSEAMHIICKELAPVWKFTSEQTADWIETVTRRLRNFMYHIHHSHAKKTKPKWLSQLPWLDIKQHDEKVPEDEEQADEDPEDEEDAPEDEESEEAPDDEDAPEDEEQEEAPLFKKPAAEK